MRRAPGGNLPRSPIGHVLMGDRADILVRVGRSLYGATPWQRALASELGRYHPLGARETIDERLMRRWIARERNVPDWVGDALRRLCDEHRRKTDEARKDLEKW